MDQLIGQSLQWGQKIHETAATCRNKRADFERQLAAGQQQQATLARQIAALLKQVEALEAQLSPKAKG